MFGARQAMSQKGGIPTFGDRDPMARMRKKRTLQDGVANEHYRVSDLSGGRLPRPVPHIECRFWAELTDRPALEKVLAGV